MLLHLTQHSITDTNELVDVKTEPNGQSLYANSEGVLSGSNSEHSIQLAKMSNHTSSSQFFININKK